MKFSFFEQFCIDNSLNFNFVSGESLKYINSKQGEINVAAIKNYLIICPAFNPRSSCITCALYSLGFSADEKLSDSSPLSFLNENKSLLEIIRNNSDKKVVIYNLNSRSITLYDMPYIHPSCLNHQKIDPLLFAEQKKERTSIFQIFEELDFPHKITDSFFIYCSWFQNPFYPLYPQVKYHDLALGSSKSKNLAIIKAKMESIERYMLLSPPRSQFIPEPKRSYVEIEKKKLSAINPNKFWKYSKNSKMPYNNINEKTVLDWSEVSDFDEKTQVLAPNDFLYINTLPVSQYNELSTSGSAAHESKHIAKLSALLELIERDNSMYYWITQEKKNIILNNTYSLNGFDILFFDMSRFETVYSTMCVLINQKNEWPKAIFGSAAAFSQSDSMDKSFDEALSSFIIGSAFEKKGKTVIKNPQGVIDPQDHAIFYRNPDNFIFLTNYLSSNKTVSASKKSFKIQDILSELRRINYDVYFFIHSDKYHISFPNTYVVRCVIPQMIPLTFGTGSLKTEHDFLNITPHEWSNKYPHPFS